MNIFTKYQILLASKSPRRSKLLEEMGFDFTIKIKEVEEIYPVELEANKVPEFLAQLKSTPFKNKLSDDQLVITADTIVLFQNKILGKPLDLTDAKNTLQKLSGNKHIVLSGVNLMSNKKSISFTDSSTVYFSEIPDEAIDYYLSIEPPLDKAGSYGIQGWIGHNYIDKIKGSYTNIMGLPTEKLFKVLMEF